MRQRYKLILLGILVICLNQGFKEKAGSGVEVVNQEKENRVDVLIDGKPFTSYIYPSSLKKPVLYPIRTSQGTYITRGYPLDPRPGEREDHPHHVGLWFNYGDVNGLDFWNNSNEVPVDRQDKMGTIFHQKINKVTSGKNEGTLEVTCQWKSASGKILLTEDTKYIFRYEGKLRIIDRITKLTALGEPVHFNDSKEGLIGLRVARELEHSSGGHDGMAAKLNNEGITTGHYLSSKGKGGDEVWGTRAEWVKLSGKINNEDIVIAIVDYPSNPGYPTYWQARGYGLFAACPLGQKVFSNGKEEFNFKIDAGKSSTFHYRILISSGNEKLDLDPFLDVSKANKK